MPNLRAWCVVIYLSPLWGFIDLDCWFSIHLSPLWGYIKNWVSAVSGSVAGRNADLRSLRMIFAALPLWGYGSGKSL